MRYRPSSCPTICGSRRSSGMSWGCISIRRRSPSSCAATRRRRFRLRSARNPVCRSASTTSAPDPRLPSARHGHAVRGDELPRRLPSYPEENNGESGAGAAMAGAAGVLRVRVAQVDLPGLQVELAGVALRGSRSSRLSTCAVLMTIQLDSCPLPSPVPTQGRQTAHVQRDSRRSTLGAVAVSRGTHHDTGGTHIPDKTLSSHFPTARRTVVGS